MESQRGHYILHINVSHPIFSTLEVFRTSRVGRTIFMRFGYLGNGACIAFLGNWKTSLLKDVLEMPLE